MAVNNAGNEIDSYCTKCKMTLNHRIVALVGDTVKRVECLTCRGQHNYRPPPEKKPAKKKRASKASGTTRTGKGRITLAEKARMAERELWESAIMGRAATDFTSYKMTLTLEGGQLIRHKKFGDGVVAEVVEDGKVQILFESGTKTLVHGR